jgi:hypothetical protein
MYNFMLKNLLNIILFSCFPFLCFSQTLKIIDSLLIEHQQISVDNYRNLYLSNSKGIILKYDSLLQKINYNYSPEKNAEITLLEARNSLRIFAFYREFQEYILLDRFLTHIRTAIIPNQEIGFARLAAPSADNQLWIFDDSDFTLKKLDIQSEKVILKTPLDLLLQLSNYNMVFLTEYQNQVFMVDKYSGILIFDNMGNFRRKIAVLNANFLSFDNEFVWFTDGYQLIKEDLYKEQQLKIELPKNYQQKVNKIVVVENYVILSLEGKIVLAKIIK